LEIWSGLFIPDPDPDFLPILDPGSRGKKCTRSRIPDPDTGSGSRLPDRDPDPQHWLQPCGWHSFIG
jgi:hypothetical protein